MAPCPSRCFPAGSYPFGTRPSRKIPLRGLKFLSLVVLLSATGCSPRIYTSVQTIFPARPADAPVLVYDEADSVPPEAETLGNVRIGHAPGATARCGYNQIVQLAKYETNKIGGNALHITQHLFPEAEGSSCHRITADMLRLSDSVFRVSAPVQTQIERKRAGWYGDRVRESRRANTVESKSGRTLYNTIQITPGYAFVLNGKPQGGSDDLGRGLDLHAAYQWTSRSGLGAGLRYAGYFASADIPDPDPAPGTTDAMNAVEVAIHYVAPEFVLRQRLGRKWLLSESVGIGYASYHPTRDGRDLYASGNLLGFGYHAAAGIEYLLFRNMGLAAGAEFYGTHFSSKEALRYIRSGTLRISVNGGLRFYF